MKDNLEAATLEIPEDVVRKLEELFPIPDIVAPE
jgi:hypothetical protein